MCGRCDGIAGVDTLGVYEFDTTTDTIVGNHIMKENFGGDPYPSPDGKYIVLIGRNGGTTVRILETGATSEPSTVFADLEMGFNSTNHEDDQIFNDFAFVELDGMSMIVFVSGTENRAAIVDISNGADNIKITYVALGGHAGNDDISNRRQVEWAVGTPYVWIDGDGRGEAYVVDVSAGTLVKTIAGISTTRMLSVQNYAKMHEQKMQQEAIQAAIEAQMAVQQQMADEQGKKESSEGSMMETNLNAAQQAAVPSNTKDDNDIDIVGILGLIIGACALIVGTMNVFVMSSMKTQIASNKDDLVSLGSKDVA
jgi:hypothetical protein